MGQSLCKFSTSITPWEAGLGFELPSSLIEWSKLCYVVICFGDEYFWTSSHLDSAMKILSEAFLD
eukprot:c43651_g1_i1 orf=100-294(+)